MPHRSGAQATYLLPAVLLTIEHINIIERAETKTCAMTFPVSLAISIVSSMALLMEGGDKCKFDRAGLRQQGNKSAIIGSKCERCEDDLLFRCEG